MCSYVFICSYVHTITFIFPYSRQPIKPAAMVRQRQLVLDHGFDPCNLLLPRQGRRFPLHLRKHDGLSGHPPAHCHGLQHRMVIKHLISPIISSLTGSLQCLESVSLPVPRPRLQTCSHLGGQDHHGRRIHRNDDRVPQDLGRRVRKGHIY